MMIKIKMYNFGLKIVNYGQNFVAWEGYFCHFIKKVIPRFSNIGKY